MNKLRRLLWSARALALPVALLSAAWGAAASAQMPPPAVVVEAIQVQPIDAHDEFLAQAEAIEAVDIRARVQGLLQEIAFHSGQWVEEGDLLFRIGPDQYEAPLGPAPAQPAGREAAQQEAPRPLARNPGLAQRQTASPATLDDAPPRADKARAA